MKKTLIIFFVLAISLLAARSLVIIQQKKTAHVDLGQRTVSEEAKKTTAIQPLGSGISPTERARADKAIPEAKKEASDELKEIKRYAKEFNLPKEVEEDLLEAVRDGEIEAEGVTEDVTEEELYEAGLSPAQIADSEADIKRTNIAAGYKVADRAFNEMVSACLPSGDDDEEERALKGEALANIGFSAMVEHKYPQAEEAFSVLISNYPDTEAASMTHLELARLMLEQGRVDEAREIVNEAISRYGDDKEYVKIATALKDTINKYE